MKISDIILTANSNLLRSKLRTFLTIMAIFIGAFALTLTSGIGSGISTYINHQLGNLGATNVLLVTSSDKTTSITSVTPQKYDPSKKISAGVGFRPSVVLLTKADIDKIKAIPGITSVVPRLALAIDYIQGATSEKYQTSVSANIRGTALALAAGRNVNDNQTDPEIVIPDGYLSSLGFSSATAALSKPVTLGLTNSLGESVATTATIVGVQQQGIIAGSSPTVNNALAQALYDQQTTGLPPAAKNKYMVLEASFDPTLSSSQQSRIKDQLMSDGYSAQTVQDAIGTFKTVIAAIIYVLDAFAIIALLTASFGIINTLLMAVKERTKEIGLMKAMGMSNGRIFLLFSAEAVMIGFWGSFLGILAAFVAGTVADHWLARGFLKDLPGLHIVAFPLTSIAAIMLIIMAIAFLAGALPARHAALQNPIDALRYE